MEASKDGSPAIQLKALHAVGTLKHRRNKRKKKLSTFERRYTALGPLLKPEQKRIDYVLVRKNKSSVDAEKQDKKENLQRRESLRERFENAMREHGISIKEAIVNDYVYTLLHCPFKRLCKEAELVKLEMPLRGCEKYPVKRRNFITEFVENHLETDDELDYISAPFRMNKIEMFEGYENPTLFFRPALRSLLTDHILRNIDIRDLSKQSEKLSSRLDSNHRGTTSNVLGAHLQVMDSWMTDFCSCCPCFRPKLDDNPDNIVLSKMGLPYMLMRHVYNDAFILHEESALSKINEVEYDKEVGATADDDIKTPLINDPRKDLAETWPKVWKFQPLWKVRNYYGEKIALYFAWTGMLVTTLWLPMLFGLACFIYGLTVSQERNANLPDIPTNLTSQEELKYRVGQLYDTISGSFDNDVTPWYALIICLWGTIFLEVWKRCNARLSYEWDVDQYEQNEPDKPEFVGTKIKRDPVTQEDNWFYPFKRQVLKYAISSSAIIMMVFLVFGSILGVTVYRVVISVDYCVDTSATSCFLKTSIASALLNAVSILILGKVYDIVAMKLTLWENHRTQTEFDDALIIKLFAFSFANSYSSCFYIAFVRGRLADGLFGLGSAFNDDCEGNGGCMSQLSFQVLVLMIAKPLPKLFMDIILPYLKRLWRYFVKCWRKKCCNNQVNEDTASEAERSMAGLKRDLKFLKKEKLKPPLNDFTLGEYTEKIVMYGFLMLFASALPLAPLIAILFLVADRYTDSKRLLWLNRRPVALIAQDLGMWYGILNFVNLVGVISNSFLIAFTSRWGQKYSLTTQLIICIAFEHSVFALKFIMTYLIPDTPKDVKLAIRREKYQVAKKFEDTGKHMDYTVLIPEATYDEKAPPNSANYADFPKLEDESDTGTPRFGGGKGTGNGELQGQGHHDLTTVIEEDEARPPGTADDPRNVSLGSIEAGGSQLNRSMSPAKTGTTATKRPLATSSPNKGKLGKDSSSTAVNFMAHPPPGPPPPKPAFPPIMAEDTDDSANTSLTSDADTDV